ncbi:MAG: 3'-5' exonuclease [Prevotellaceae bacterium]|jgi:DNA polymerase-3 subunit epsilon|nr:3'-5' exonuclease [Prevotellaceae bacterium]
MNFVAIDFETANSKRSSACSIGLAYVQNGILTSSESYLIKPSPSFFEQANINIHGITPDMVKNAPNFSELWKIIAPKIIDKTIVAHNATFDISVLKNALMYYAIDVPNINYYCSYKISKQSIYGLENYRLSTVCEYLNIPLKHHDSESDARAAALIILNMLKKYGVKTLQELNNLSIFQRNTPLVARHGKNLIQKI